MFHAIIRATEKTSLAAQSIGAFVRYGICSFPCPRIRKAAAAKQVERLNIDMGGILVPGQWADEFREHPERVKRGRPFRIV